MASTNGQQLGEINLSDEFADGFYSVIYNNAKVIVLKLEENGDLYHYPPDYKEYFTTGDNFETLNLLTEGPRFSMDELAMSFNYCRIIRKMPKGRYLNYERFKEIIQINTLSNAFINIKQGLVVFKGKGHGTSYKAVLAPVINHRDILREDYGSNQEYKLADCINCRKKNAHVYYDEMIMRCLHCRKEYKILGETAGTTSYKFIGECDEQVEEYI